MNIDAELAAKLDSEERAIRIAEQLAHRLGRQVEVFDAAGNRFWISSPEPAGKPDH